MAKLPNQLYLPDSDEPEGVLNWGKSREQREQDCIAGVARLGGGRSANYDQAYLLSASTLFQSAQASRTLDHHGLAIFYLQRHAAELMMKDMLHIALEIQEFRARINADRPTFPKDEKQAKRASTAHGLSDLLNDLIEMASAMEVGPVPDELVKAVEEIELVEKKSDTWSRYSIGKIKEPNGRLRQHLENEVILPLGRLQDLLQAANISIGDLWPADGMLGQLGELHQYAMRDAGLIDR